MRTVIAATAIAMWLAPSAGAAFGPPLVAFPSTLRSLPLPLMKGAEKQKATSSCSGHVLRSRLPVVWIGRKLLPVACEQPPRSNLVDAGFVILLVP